MSESQDSKTCFVIAPIGDEGSVTRKRSDQVFDYIIDKVVPNFGYKATRADRISEPGIITSQIIQRLVEADLVIADMTDKNPNVFYELAVRHAFRKPAILLIDADQTIPFDVSSMRTIKVDVHDLGSVERCKDEIASQIRNFESHDPDTEIETPISAAINIQQLQQSNNPVSTGIADIKLAVGSLSAEIGGIQSQLRTVAQASDLPRISSFSGIGSGTYNHGLGVRPDAIILHTADGSLITYDSATDSTVHVEMPEAPMNFVGIAIAVAKPYGFVIQRPTNATPRMANMALQTARIWLQSNYPDGTVEESKQGRSDFSLTQPDGTVTGIEVKYVRDPYRLRNVMADIYLFAEGEWQKEYIVFLIGSDQIAMEDIKRLVTRYDLHKPLVRFVVGYYDAIGDFREL